MGRIHLLELEDQPWFPSLLRDLATDFLQFSQTVIDQMAVVVPKLSQAITAAKASRIVDLCSGGGGPWPRLIDHMYTEGHATPVILTDKFPNQITLARVRAASGDRIDYVRHPVDATEVPNTLDGLRTLFNGFHHFRPEDGREILQDAVDRRQPIAIFEMLDGGALCMLGVVLSALLVVPVVTPFIRPFRWSRLLFTYLIPLVPLTVLWDGLVSCLRIYSPQELGALCEALESNDYEWEVDTLENPLGPTKIIYLLGVPGKAAPP